MADLLVFETRTNYSRRELLIPKGLLTLGRFHIPRDQLDIDHSGTGSLGVVVKRARMVGRTSDVAVRIFNPRRDQRVVYRLIREMLKWSRLQHRNILPLIGFHLSQDLDTALIICPLEPHGNIKDYIQRVQPGACSRLGWALDTLYGLMYLHELVPPVVHGNIKVANVLLNADNRAVLSDFRSTSLEDIKWLGSSDTFVARYDSPEVVMDEAPRTIASDVWSWGCLLIEIMKEVPPYSHLRSETAVVFAMWKGISPWPEEDLKQPIDMWSVVEHCWNPDPAKRMGPRACGKYMRTLAAGSLKSAPDDEQRKLLEVLESTHFATPTIPMLQQGAGKECVQDENHQIPASKTDVVDNLRQLFRSLMKRTPTIPNKVLDLILRHCSRFSLANCCHINRRFYSIAVMHLYEDPFAVDQFDYLGYGGSFHTRLTGLLETLENNNHLAKLVRVFRNRFWSQEYMWRRAITRVLPHLKHLITLDFYARDYPVELRNQILIIVAALRDHSPSVRHIKFDALPNYPRPQGDFEMIRVLSSSLLHLRDIDVTIPCDVDAEPLLTMVQTIAKTCPGLRFIKWKSISYHQQGHAYPLGQAQRVFQFALIDDIWETVQDSGIERASSHLF